MRTVILDFDGSVRGIDGAEVIGMRHREEEVRFACSVAQLRSLRIPDDVAIAFLGSGDFHHVTLPLVERIAKPVEVVVFDNHPDNMRYPFGIHCGSWVAHVARLPFVSHVHVAGIASPDVEGWHVAENHLRELRSGKVLYWCVGKDLRWLRRCGVRDSRTFDTADAMLAALGAHLGDSPLYVSIDKDVLESDVVQTNWDQGVMRFEQLAATLESFRGRVIAADVTGDVSSYRYRSRWKRLLSRLDHQPQLDATSIDESQGRHGEINRELLRVLRSALR